jgi:hypothetical protein
MGNTQTHDQQTDSFFSALPEDIVILLTDLLSTQDFVHLIMSCKYYYHDLLGANNALWARVCRSLGGANKVLKDLQYYRRWKVVNFEGEAIDFNKELDVTDKQVLASIDFKKEIFNYYLLIINNRLLRQKIEKFLIFGAAVHPTVKVLPYSFWSSFSQYWTRADLKSNKYHRDFFYEVDLQYDPASVEEMSYEAANLPDEQGGRLVVYKKSKNKPRREIFSRTEIMHQVDTILEEAIKVQEVV